MKLLQGWLNSTFEKRGLPNGSTHNNQQPEYRCVIVGAGSGGCVTAYTIGRQMLQMEIPGKVLLIDSGKPLKHQG